MFDIRCRLLSSLYWKPTVPLVWYYGQMHFSEHGQDAILPRLIGIDQGFYVDVGAHHPFHLSNTYFLHRRGWTGINIEPNPEGYDAFRKHRPLDVNLQTLVAGEEGELDFFMYSCSAMNTCCPETVRRNEESLGLKPERTIRIGAQRLDSILRKHVSPGTNIDFLNVDCEGSDLRVLDTNDWTRFRSSWIVVEDFDASADSRTTRYLEERAYQLVGFWEIVKVFKLIP